MPGPPTSRASNLRNSPKKGQALSKSGRMLGIKDPIRGILNSFEYCLPVFSFCCLKTMTLYGPQMQLFGGPLRILLAVLIQNHFTFVETPCKFMQCIISSDGGPSLRIESLRGVSTMQTKLKAAFHFRVFHTHVKL